VWVTPNPRKRTSESDFDSGGPFDADLYRLAFCAWGNSQMARSMLLP